MRRSRTWSSFRRRRSSLRCPSSYGASCTGGGLGDRRWHLAWTVPPPRSIGAGGVAPAPRSLSWPHKESSGLLQAVAGLVVLPKAPNILTCGAYEAVSAGKPAVLSDWPQMRRYFPRGFVYASNTPEGIARGIEEMLANRDTLAAE